VTDRPRPQSVLPPIRLGNGTVEGLKWTGLVLMTLDHINKYLLHESVPALFALGRLALPLFGVVLAFNLARPGTLERGVYPRMLGRLAIAAAISEIPFMALGGLAWGWYPFDILVTLMVATAIMWTLEAGGSWRVAWAIVIFLVGGALVEFWWPGVAMCVAAWLYCRRPSYAYLLWWIGATAALYLINRNLWALAALPLIFYAPHVHWRVPRIRYAFYMYYPAHLAVIWTLSR
jgi:hypothetical protein